MPPNDPTSTPILMLPGECNVPLPVNKVIRRHRFFQVAKAVKAVAPADDKTPRLYPVVAPLTPASLALAIRRLRADSTGIDLLGGLPLGALKPVVMRRLGQKLLPQVTVKDVEGLAEKGQVSMGGQLVQAHVTPQALVELATTGKAIVQVGTSSRQLVGLTLDEVGRARAPEVIHVSNVMQFLEESLVRGRDGAVVRFTLDPNKRKLLEDGKAIVVQAEGRRALLAPPASTGKRATRSTPTSPPVPATPIATEQPAVSDEAPAFAQLIPFEQTWELLGYERGELVSAITLTPQEETTVEVFSWDRRKTSTEDSLTSESESSSESQLVDRDTREVMDELTQSGEFTWNTKGSVQVKFGGDNSFGTENQTGVKVSASDVAKATQQALRERTVKATERVKSSRQTRVTEAAELGSETRTSRRLRNPNLGHAVTYHFFEVLKRYHVETRCVTDDVGLVLLAPNPLKSSLQDLDTIRHEELTLRKALLDRTVAAGFDAARFLFMADRACGELRRRHAETADPVLGTGERQDALDAAGVLADKVIELDDVLASFRWVDYFDRIVPLDPGTDDHQATPLGYDVERAVSAWAFVAAWQQLAPSAWPQLLRAARAVRNATAIGREAALLSLAKTVKGLDAEKSANALAPDDKVRDALLALVWSEAFSAYSGFVARLLAAIEAGEFVLAMLLGVLTPTGALATVVTDWSSEPVVVGAIASAMSHAVSSRPGLAATDDHGVVSAAKSALEAYDAMRTAEKEELKEERKNARNDQALREASLNTMFPVSRVLEARERLDALVAHLTQYKDYYGYQLLMSQRAAGRDLRPPAILGLGSAVEPTPIALVGGMLAYKVNVNLLTDDQKNEIHELLGTEPIVVATETDEFTLPTPGLVAEPRLSHCSGAEDYVTTGRAIELDLRRAQARQAVAEAERLEARLEQQPPLLDRSDPALPPLNVRVESNVPAK